MNAFLIINPVAGQTRPQASLSEWQETLRSFVGETLVTQAKGDAEAAARRASKEGRFDAVLVAGGDGTINEVVNGLMAEGTADQASLPLGIIPVGTQNVLAHELGIPGGDPAAFVAVLRNGKTRGIDLGHIEDRYFTLNAGFGFDAAVVRDVLLPVKELIGPAAYALSTLQTLANYRSTEVRLRLDGEEVTTQAYLVVVANAATYAFRQVKMTPFASLDDGWLDVCVFERAPMDRVGFVTQIMALIARRHLRDPRVRYYRARRVEIASDPPIQGQIDGDTFRETPVTVEVVPKAITVFVP